MLISPNAILFDALVTRATTVLPTISHVDQDYGQLENYQLRPAVSWPCLLIDIEEFKFTDTAGQLLQVAEGIISFRLGLVQYSNSTGNTPKSWRDKALAHYELENNFYKAFHGWAPEGFSRLLRRAEATEKREDDIRVRVSKYLITYTDTTAQPGKVTIPKPGPIILA